MLNSWKFASWDQDFCHHPALALGGEPAFLFMAAAALDHIIHVSGICSRWWTRSLRRNMLMIETQAYSIFY
jgi:hypothetical protein